MRTTIDIPDDVLAEAQRVTRFRSKTDLVTHALRELVRHWQFDELIAAAGTLGPGDLVEVDRGKSRRRSAVAAGITTSAATTTSGGRRRGRGRA